MICAICAIARFENRYIREWVDYHLSIGFSHIYIYDNNRQGEERISDALDITSLHYSNRVDIIPFHEVTVCPQLKAYNDCYKRFDFNWMAFIDIDEFITISSKSGYKNVEEFIQSKKDFDVILLNWMFYGDNGHLSNNETPVLERFKTPLPIHFSVSNLFGKQPINGHVKSIVKSGLDTSFHSPHVCYGDFKCCNADGQRIPNKAYQWMISVDKVYIRHFYTKSTEEFLETKCRRPAADASFEHYNVMSYFYYNKPTIRKILLVHKFARNKAIDFSMGICWWLKCYLKMWIISPIYFKFVRRY